jgi:hypothetical protein
LTAKERVFAERFAATQDRNYAAEKAGYTQPGSDSGRVLARPAVQSDIRRRVREGLANLGELAVDTLRQAMTSTTSRWSDKVAAAKIVIGHVDGEEAGGKEPSEMTFNELQATIEALRIRQAELAEQAKPILEVSVNNADLSSVFD